MIRVSKGTGSRRHVINQVFRGTLADAKRHARDLETSLDTGRAMRSKLQFKDYFDLWIRSVTPKLAPRTVDGYDRYIRRYALESIGHLNLSDIQTHHIQAVYIDVGVSLSATTVRNLHASLNACFSWAIKHHYIDINPCKHTERPAKVRKERAILDESEAARFVAACREMPNGIIFEFALETGTRPGEYLALRWSDITGDSVSIDRSVQFHAKGGGWYFKEPKTSRSRRRIPLSASLRQRLNEYRRRQLEHRMALPVTWNDLDLVFPNIIGNPMEITNLIRRYLKPILDKAKIEKPISPYSLRHSCATLLLMHGINPKVVADRLGHSSVTLTLDTYSHVLPHIQSEATETLSEILQAKTA